MKSNISKYFGLALVVFAALFTLNAAFDDAPLRLYRYDFRTTADTITDTGADTFSVPGVLHSKWSYGWDFDATQISGTTDLTCSVQEQIVTDGPWTQVGTINLDSTSSGRVVGATVYGVKQRCICTGTGTQSTQIDVYAIYKRN